jgi:hypothetical protein
VAQIAIAPPSTGLAACSTYEALNPDEAPLSVEECLKQVCVADNLLHTAGGPNTDVRPYPDCAKHTETGRASFAKWARLETHNQAQCWIKFSKAYGYDSVDDWGHDPFVTLPAGGGQASAFSFLMPNTRRYEHFFNDPECNQLFRMGRGREQPDAITFYDVPAHDHNTLVMNNRVQITPWITHDQMVIQMFGLTDRCVAVRPDMPAMGRGLVNGTFRIEYKNASGVVSVEGVHFGKDIGYQNNISEKVSTINGVNNGLLETNVCITRTPHYLAVCADDLVATFKYTGGACPTYCEYWTDWKQHDYDVPIDMYGNWTVPCGKHDVISFNGTNSADNLATINTVAAPGPPINIERPRVNAIVFPEKCASDAFLLLDGQIVNIAGNLTGPLEFELLQKGLTYLATDIVFEFYLDGDNPWAATQVTKADITSIFAATEHAD